MVYPEIEIDVPDNVQVRPRQLEEPLSVLFVGRLLSLKGAHLAIRAVAEAIAQGVSIEFTLVGKGPFEPELRKVAASLNLLTSIRWIDSLPQKDLFALYQTMPCFLFPSLHDSSGNVVLEAQANGLPVICLDICEPATLVTTETATVVPTQDQSEADVVQSLAEALMKLATTENKRIAMAEAAITHTEQNMNWKNRTQGALDLLVQVTQHQE